MKAEIGSNFWEYSYNKSRRNFWWEKGYNISYFKSGRNAVKAVCMELSDYKGEILMPAYLCETEIEPWSENGWQVSFYPVESDFSVDPIKLKKFIEDNTPSVLFVQNYFGFHSVTVACEKVLSEFQKKGLIIIEDITQSIFTKEKYDKADYYVASLRKFFAIPDGGIVLSKNKLKDMYIKKSDSQIDEYARRAFDLKREYFETMDKYTKEKFRADYVSLNELISINDGLYDISPMSKKIFLSIDSEEICGPRIDNYSYLSKLIRTADIGEVPLALIGSAVPLFLPVLLNEQIDRIGFRAYLAEHDIYCPIIWQHPDKVPKCYDSVEKIYNHILCFPIDQRYDFSDMDRIYDTIVEWKTMKG